MVASTDKIAPSGTMLPLRPVGLLASEGLCDNVIGSRNNANGNPIRIVRQLKLDGWRAYFINHVGDL